MLSAFDAILSDYEESRPPDNVHDSILRVVRVCERANKCSRDGEGAGGSDAVPPRGGVAGYEATSLMASVKEAGDGTQKTQATRQGPRRTHCQSRKQSRARSVAKGTGSTVLQ